MGSSSSKSEVQEVLRAGWLKALEAGTWGPAGDADVDFPVGTPEGLLYNPKSECQRRLQGKDAKVVGEACSVANQWLADSHAKTGAADLLLRQLQREPKPRPLIEAEKSIVCATDTACQELRRDVQQVAKLFANATRVCKADHEANNGFKNLSEDCRQLWGRTQLVERRVKVVFGTGLSREELSQARPTCLVIKQLAAALGQVKR